MSKMAPISQKKRKLEEGIQGRTSRPKKRIRKQQDYHSSEDDESGNEGGFAPVNLDDSDDETKAPPATGANSTERKPAKKQRKPQSKSQADIDDDEASSDDASASANSNSDSDINTTADKPSKPKTKRNDPSAFTTSITRILSTTLPASTKSDPVLSRSTTYHTTTTALKNDKLSARAAALLRNKKREELDRQRDKDVTGVQSGRAGEVQEEERRLRKIAQRGVVRLFNAVRAAQGGVDAKGEGGVGRKEREEKGREMSKRGFLELIGVKGVKAGDGEGEGLKS